jgi:hypothetical protein
MNSNKRRNVKDVGYVINTVRETSDKKEKKSILKMGDSLALRTLLRLQFDSRVEHELPPGIPEGAIIQWPNEEAPANLTNSYRHYVHFLKNAPHNQIKKESMFLRILGRLNSNDANILIEVKDKKLNLGLTKKEIQSVFPDIFG